MIKKVFLGFFMLASCGVYTETSLDEAMIFHWENRFVTMQTFIDDHKKCLGVQSVRVNSRLQNVLDPGTPKTVPKWDGIWATFQSRESGEHSQRIAVSASARQGTASADIYEDCMLEAGYNLVNY